MIATGNQICLGVIYGQSAGREHRAAVLTLDAVPEKRYIELSKPPLRASITFGHLGTVWLTPQQARPTGSSWATLPFGKLPHPFNACDGLYGTD